MVLCSIASLVVDIQVMPKACQRWLGLHGDGPGSATQEGVVERCNGQWKALQQSDSSLRVHIEAAFEARVFLTKEPGFEAVWLIASNNDLGVMQRVMRL
jgi:hypothetical protein